MESVSVRAFAVKLLNHLGEVYLGKILKHHIENGTPTNEITGFLVNPEKIVVYIGKNHVAIEYIGAEVIDTIRENYSLDLVVYDYVDVDVVDFYNLCLGIVFDGTAVFRLPIEGIIDDLIMASNSGIDKLLELKWNFQAQDMLLNFNSSGIIVPEGSSARIINGFFYDTHNDGLITRRIKWMDFIPVKTEEIGPNDIQFSISTGYYQKNWLRDAQFLYPRPLEFCLKKLWIINRFIECFGGSSISELDITSFLGDDENSFILKMGFSCTNIYPQLNLEWQSEANDPIRPDFLILRANGYADIVEFKLPSLKGEAIVGITNRERFSAELQAYIAQTRKYKVYFEDPNNRAWVLKTYGIQVYSPRRFLVVGRRYNFASPDWREIKNEYQDLEIITFDDLVDTVTCQLYS